MLLQEYSGLEQLCGCLLGACMFRPFNSTSLLLMQRTQWVHEAKVGLQIRNHPSPWMKPGCFMQGTVCTMGQDLDIPSSSPYQYTWFTGTSIQVRCHRVYGIFKSLVVWLLLKTLCFQQKPHYFKFLHVMRTFLICPALNTWLSNNPHGNTFSSITLIAHEGSKSSVSYE